MSDRTEVAIRELLLGDLGVRALADDRIYSGNQPQARKTNGAVTLKKISKTSELTMDAIPGQNQVRIQVDCWHPEVDQVRELANAVNGDDSQTQPGALHGFSGPAGGMTLRMVRLISERSTDYEDESNLYRVGADYMVHL